MVRDGAGGGGLSWERWGRRMVGMGFLHSAKWALAAPYMFSPPGTKYLGWTPLLHGSAPIFLNVVTFVSRARGAPPSSFALFVRKRCIESMSIESLKIYLEVGKRSRQLSGIAASYVMSPMGQSCRMQDARLGNFACFVQFPRLSPSWGPYLKSESEGGACAERTLLGAQGPGRARKRVVKIIHAG